MVREGAVELKVQRHEFAGEMEKDPWYDHSCHTIARVDNYFEGFDLAHIDKREHMIDIIIGNIKLCYHAFIFWLCESSTHCQVTDISQSGLQTDGKGLRTAELHAVVLSGIVRRGNHHTSG